MPYIDAQFQRRVAADRPLVVPEGAQNFAFPGQFAEIPSAVIFTFEYSVRSAMMAVCHHFGIGKDIPSRPSTRSGRPQGRLVRAAHRVRLTLCDIDRRLHTTLPLHALDTDHHEHRTLPARVVLHRPCRLRQARSKDSGPPPTNAASTHAWRTLIAVP